MLNTPEGGAVLMLIQTWTGDAAERDRWLQRLGGLGQPEVAASGLVDFAEPL